ncbi:hypothetical protein G3A_11885 [Bacillus sp. 17376]|uniref:Uncharacterized protein n=1 Tax=Mesobacillus boroniphilus JCM 21738 TaxID=1294265 RepID=W4RN93_9BACI|nr:hypothetical protein [Mesobacillus boroniphilus]ESU32357.1 hypothetical protein G3A_11885 [Bacillus sp. 17376]GAE45059.1 hypothetical protein JCM21738_1828 [Mesobacillus boroniphilus JCM 21738]
MHFRQLIITGFIVGAAMLIPDLAFAEKGANAGNPQKPVTAEQVTLPDKAENAQTSGKTPGEPAVKNQPVQKPVVQKPAQAKQKDKPADAGKSNKKAQSFKKNEKAALPQKAKALINDKSKQVKHKTMHSNKQSNKDALQSIHNKGHHVKETQRRSPGLKEKVEPSKESAVTPSFVKVTAKTASKETPPVKNDGNDSSKNERYPKGDNIPNPPSRTKASGGPSSDRTSYGNASTFINDKWFVWDESFNLNLKQPYTSRVAVFQSQWVNAPPSPPPLKAPAFLPYTDAIATDHVN